jgi:hypothetical protein
MTRKIFSKFVLLIPALTGLLLMASVCNDKSDQPDKKKQKAEVVVIDGVEVDNLVYDFGTISEDAGELIATFKLTNKTKNPVLITQVTPGCGCTTASYTKEPIDPRKSGEITAKYNPKGRAIGPFTKTITVIVSGVQNPIQLKIKGVAE